MRLLKQGLLLLTLLIVGPCSLQRAGLCISEGRFFSKDELLERAVLQLNKNIITTYLDTHQTKTTLPYASVSAFLKANPDCCEIDPKPPNEVGRPTFEIWFLGWDSHIFKTKYLQHYTDGSQETIQGIGYQNNCGEFFED